MDGAGDGDVDGDAGGDWRQDGKVNKAKTFKRGEWKLGDYCPWQIWK